MKKVLVGVAFLGILGAPYAVQASEGLTRGDDNIPYHEEVQPYKANSRTSGRYRQTTNITNPWKVDMTYSNEVPGDNTALTNYWLEAYDGENVSEVVAVSVNHAAKYTRGYTTSFERTVYLTMENNNYNSNVYTVKGIWDEETY